MPISPRRGLRSLTLSFILASLGASSVAFAETLVFRDGLNDFNGTVDTFLHKENSTTNYQSNTTLAIGYSSNSSAGSGARDTARETRNMLIRFDDLGLTDFTASSAELTLTIASIGGAGGSAGVRFYAHEVLAPWTEAQATWNNATTDLAWETPGAIGALDRAPAFFTSDVYTINSDTASLNVGGTVTIALPTSLVQSWIDDPSSNYGILLSVAATSQYRYPTFTVHSSEADELLRPTLTITGTAIPEPGTFPLLAGVAVLSITVLRRRNRG